MFHRVLPAQKGPRIGNHNLEVTPEFLEATIKYFIKRGYGFIALDDLPDITAGLKSGRRFVAFTFDDGYADNLEYAYPIFKKYGIPFTIYVSTAFPDGNGILWWYPLEDMLLAHDHLDLEIAGVRREFDCSTMRGKISTFSVLNSIIKTSDKQAYWERLKEIFSSLEIDPFNKTAELTLNWDQIRQLSLDKLVTIGAHTVNHLSLIGLSESEARAEIGTSKQRLESMLGQSVQHFAYPYGTMDYAGLREYSLVQEFDFTTAVTTCQGNVFPEHCHYLERLPRLDIDTTGQKERRLGVLGTGALAALTNGFRRLDIEPLKPGNGPGRRGDVGGLSPPRPAAG